LNRWPQGEKKTTRADHIEKKVELADVVVDDDQDTLDRPLDHAGKGAENVAAVEMEKGDNEHIPARRGKKMDRSRGVRGRTS